MIFVQSELALDDFFFEIQPPLPQFLIAGQIYIERSSNKCNAPCLITQSEQYILYIQMHALLKRQCQATFYQNVLYSKTEVKIFPIYFATIYMGNINRIKLQHTILGNILSKFDKT